MLGKALQELSDKGLFRVSVAAEVTRLDNSTIYKWMSGQTRPSFDAVALLATHYPCEHVRSALVQVFTAGASRPGGVASR